MQSTKRWLGRLMMVLALMPLGAGLLFAQNNPFVTKWHAEAANEVLKIPIKGTNYKLTWEKEGGAPTEKMLTTSPDSPYALTVTEAGDYIVKVYPQGVTQFQMCDPEDVEKSYGSAKALVEVVAWGDVVWEDMTAAFVDCVNMVFGPNVGKPNLSKVKSIGKMFAGCSSFNQPVEEWDVSKVTDMSATFANCTQFNQPLEKWDVSKVEDMSGMLARCVAFNQPLNEWKITKVKNMESMFLDCSAFNQPLDKWKMTTVTNTGAMFAGCTIFNQPLDKWDMSSVDWMAGMFAKCPAFNQPLNGWTVSKVTSMEQMFNGCKAFNQPLDKWDVSKVEKLAGIFDDCTMFNQSLGAWKFRAGAGATFFSIGLKRCGMSQETYDATITGWAADADARQRVDIEAEGLHYTCNLAGRTELMTKKHWRFHGDVSNCFTIEGPNEVPLDGDVQLVAKFNDMVPKAEQVVNWNSNAMEIATVGTSNGKVHGVKVGDATIIAKWKNETQSYPVQVIIPVETISVKPFEVTMKPTDSPVQLAVKFTPENATKKELTWSVEPEGIVTVENGKVTPIKPGKAKVTVMAHNGKKDVCEVTVTQEVTEVTLAPATLSLALGGAPGQITATVKPDDATDKTLTWTVEPEGIVNVEEGKITPLKEGSAKVIATAKNGVKGECLVTVTDATKPISVTVTPATLEIKLGAAPAELKAVVEPQNVADQTVKWSVEPEGIASVDNDGKVTPIKAGLAHVIATAKNGVKGKCVVTVVDPASPVVRVTSVTIDPATLTMRVGDTPAQLTTKVLPEDATYKELTWSVEPADVIRLENGKVTPLKEGTARIEAKAHNGITGVCQVTVMAVSTPKPNPNPGTNPGTSVEALKVVTVSPNPFSSQLTVHSADQVLRYELVNMHGVVVANGRNSGDTFTFSTAHLPQGLYILRLHSADSSYSVRVVK